MLGSTTMSPLDHLADLAPERVRPLKRTEYETMVAAGSFADERVELLEGVIVEMSPQSPSHAAAIQPLDRVLQRLIGDRAAIRVQMPFAAGDLSLPEPDVAVVPPGDYETAHPAQALLVIEVADSSLRKDRRLKVEIDARAGVPEYWVVGLVDGLVEVYTEPTDGAYRRVTPACRRDRIRPGAVPDVEIAVDDILR
jgi:Uma2 family endonuclease